MPRGDRSPLRSWPTVRMLVAVISVALMGVAIWLAHEPVPADGPLPFGVPPESGCPSLLPPAGDSLCPHQTAERAVQVSALFAVGVLGLVAAVLLDRFDVHGWSHRLAWSGLAGAVVPVLALVGIRLGQQQNHFITGVPLALLIPGLLVVVAGCVALVRPVWPTLALGATVGLAQALPLTFFIHQIWSHFGS